MGGRALEYALAPAAGYSSRGGKNLSTQRVSLYRGSLVDLGLETADLPDGRRVEFEVVRHPGGAAVAALEGGSVCLLRHYRHAAGEWLWEVPAGKLDPGESPLETARRELAEEAGLEARSWETLGSILTTPGFCDEVIHLFAAGEFERVPTRLGADELLEVHWVDFERALGWLRDGTIRDAKTVVALLRAAEVRGRG